MSSDATRTDLPASAPEPPGGSQNRLRLIDVARLLDGQNELRLLHRGQEYRLRVTKQGKLILTK
jgi:hemin uptake protein HemP